MSRLNDSLTFERTISMTLSLPELCSQMTAFLGCIVL